MFVNAASVIYYNLLIVETYNRTFLCGNIVRVSFITGDLLLLQQFQAFLVTCPTT